VVREELLKKTVDIIAASDYVVAFTGAGISTESGIPDFRSPGGLWTQYDPQEYATYKAFLANPAKYWTMAKEVRKVIMEAKPNAAHNALAILENKFNKLKTVITQNIDYLHTVAGNSQVLELHGTYQWNYCMICKSKYTFLEVKKLLDREMIPPLCSCGGVIKSSSILFGESLPQQVVHKASLEVQKCDCLIVIGSSLQIQPAASLPFVAASHGSRIIIINREPTYLDYLAEVVLHDDASILLTNIIERLNKLQPD